MACNVSCFILGNGDAGKFIWNTGNSAGVSSSFFCSIKYGKAIRIYKRAFSNDISDSACGDILYFINKFL